MQKFFSMAALAAVTLVLNACGGSAFTGSSAGGATTVATLTVTTDTASIPSDGSSGANITVVAKDSKSAVVSGAVITFTASNGGSVTATQGTTDSTGTAKATLVVGTAAIGATITVTATSGAGTGQAAVTVANAQKTLTLLTSSPQIPSDNSAAATISAIVKDANNNLLAGVPVSFQVTTGAITAVKTAAGGTTVAAGTTDANGLAQAVVTTPGDPTNRTITVNASAGTATGQLTVGVTGTSLSLTGPSTLVQNSTPAACAVVLTNSAGQGISGSTVTLSSANNNMLSAASLITDGNGRGTFTVKGTVGGNDTITATALGLTQKLAIAVSTQSFNITAPADGTKVNLGATQQVTVTWVNNGTAVANQPVTFATTRGTLVPSTPVMTDANGQAVVSVSSTSAGPSIVQATGSGVSAQIGLDFVALAPSQISVQAGPAAVAVQGTSTITALVRDASNNLVEGATVNFQVTSDPTNGGLSSASAVSDAQGRAQTVYTAGNTSSGANGVTISATVASVPTVTGTTQLTVGGQAVFLSLGTGNTIDTSQGVAVYQVVYTVFAVDSHGAALPNVPITVSMLPVAYGKGAMGGCPGSTTWQPIYSTLTTDTYAYKSSKMCVNEDTDYTGNINSLGIVAGHPVKDYNNNNKLDPGNVAVAAPSSGVTDASGRFDVKVTYPRDHAYWVEVSLVASTTVQGTQSSTSATFVLQGAVTDYGCSTGPPGPVSPYGQAGTCANSN